MHDPDLLTRPRAARPPPSPEAHEPARPAWRTRPPSAAVVVTMPPGAARHLPQMLDVLGASTGPAGLRLAAGALAVLVLPHEPGAVEAVMRDRAGRDPFMIQAHPVGVIQGSPFDLGARFARSLGTPDAAVFLLDVRRPPAAGWLYAAAARLRDGEERVRAPRGPLARLGIGPDAPCGVSGAGLVAAGLRSAEAGRALWGRGPAHAIA